MPFITLCSNSFCVWLLLLWFNVAIIHVSNKIQRSRIWSMHKVFGALWSAHELIHMSCVKVFCWYFFPGFWPYVKFTWGTEVWVTLTHESVSNSMWSRQANLPPLPFCLHTALYPCCYTTTPKQVKSLTGSFEFSWASLLLNLSNYVAGELAWTAKV